MGQLIGSISDSTKGADVKIETEKSGMIAWRIVGGKILASLHFDMKPTLSILNTVCSMFSVEPNALNWRYLWSPVLFYLFKARSTHSL